MTKEVFRVGQKVTLATTAYDRNQPRRFKIPRGEVVEIKKFEFGIDKGTAAVRYILAHVTNGTANATVNVSLLRRIG